jgi:hypothetical protein
MTHAEALAGNTAGLAPSDCPGELAAGGSYPDRHLSRRGFVGRTVTIHRCAACGHVVSIAVEGGVSFVLNDYRPAAGLVAELAGALDARRAMPKGAGRGDGS